METDAETYIQILDRVWGIFWRRERRIEGAREVKDTTRKLTELTNLGPWGLMETGVPTREHSWDRRRPSTNM